MEDGDSYRCDALVVTTGTFLNGLVHVGRDQKPAGRAGEPPSRDLAESLKSFGFSWGRLKTGTPPRLHKRSIDFSRFSEERGDDPPVAVLVPERRDRSSADRLSPGAHDRARARARARAHRGVAALQRADLRHRSALLPVARRQGDAVSAPRASPDLPRARGHRGGRNLRERLLDEPSGGRPGEDRPRAARASKTRRSSVPATRSSTTSSSRPSSIARCRRTACRASSSPGKSTGPPATKRPARRGLLAGINAARAVRRSDPGETRAATRPTSASSWTISPRAAAWSRTGCSRRAPSIACFFGSTTRTCG